MSEKISLDSSVEFSFFCFYPAEYAGGFAFVRRKDSFFFSVGQQSFPNGASAPGNRYLYGK